MRVLRLPARPQGHAPTEVILLPAAYSTPEDFIAAGFAEAVQARGLALDLTLPALEFAHVTDRTSVSRLLDEVLAPARSRGAAVWLGGISLGGYVALCCAERSPPGLAGIVLFAPYLGSHLITGEVARTGLAAWRAGDAAAEDEERQIWRFLQDVSNRPRVHLGLGREDRFAERHRVLAAALEPGDVDVVSGGHDWPTWRRLWENFLDARLPARS